MNQIRFDPLDYNESVAEAKRARDEKYRELKKQGVAARRWVLRNQLKQYAGFGIPDGRVRDIFFVSINRATGE